MRIIKQLSGDIACNIQEAQEKIEMAYRLRATAPQEALWYREMAAAHMGFNTKGHELVAAQINAYKNGPEYKAHPEYADGMMAVWQDRHNDLTAQSARVRAMIEAFK